MTQKNKTILVGILALSVWIYAGKEWLGYLGTETNSTNVAYTNASPLPSKLYISNEKYDASYNYDDPFLTSKINFTNQSSSTINTEQRNSPLVKINEPNKTNNAKIVVEKQINYQGLISNDQGIFGLLTINDKSYVVSKGDFVDEIKVLSIEKNEILVVLNGETINIKK